MKNESRPRTKPDGPRMVRSLRTIFSESAESRRSQTFETEIEWKTKLAKRIMHYATML